MDNKFNNMLDNFLEKADIKSQEDLDAKIQEFMEKFNENDIEYENTLLDDAYEILFQAENAETKKEAIKLAKKAYKLCPACLDAILFQVDLEESFLKREKLLNEGLEYEKERLKQEGYFSKENIGIFYGIFETRPYIRGLYSKAMNLFIEGKIKQSRDVCKEILKLNESDNTGARYLLMLLYAYLEEEKNVLNIYKKYQEESLEMLFPLFLVYYKLSDYKKANEYLNKINKQNKHFIKLFKGTIKVNENVPEGYYSKGDSSEVLMYFQQYISLLIATPSIHEYILENSKAKK